MHSIRVEHIMLKRGHDATHATRTADPLETTLLHSEKLPRPNSCDEALEGFCQKTPSMGYELLAALSGVPWFDLAAVWHCLSRFERIHESEELYIGDNRMTDEQTEADNTFFSGTSCIKVPVACVSVDRC